MEKLLTFIHYLNMLRVRLFLKFQPMTWRQLHIWVKLYELTDLSCLENYFRLYLQQGIICRNILFRNRLEKNLGQAVDK